MGSGQTGAISWFVAVRTGLDAILASIDGKTNNGGSMTTFIKVTRKKLSVPGMGDRPDQIAPRGERMRTNDLKK